MGRIAHSGTRAHKSPLAKVTARLGQKAGRESKEDRASQVRLRPARLVVLRPARRELPDSGPFKRSAFCQSMFTMPIGASLSPGFGGERLGMGIDIKPEATVCLSKYSLISAIWLGPGSLLQSRPTPRVSAVLYTISMWPSAKCQRRTGKNHVALITWSLGLWGTKSAKGRYPGPLSLPVTAHRSSRASTPAYLSMLTLLANRRRSRQIPI